MPRRHSTCIYSPSRRFPAGTAPSAPLLSSSAISIVSVLLFCAGCGGGSTSQSAAAPAPAAAADFSLSLSVSSLSVAQGATSAPVSVTVNAQNGFSGQVQVSLAGLPANVVANPASPFSLAAGGSAQILFGAGTQAAAGNFTINAQATSGPLSHSANLALTIQSAPAVALPRTAYARTNSSPAADNPPSEAHHHHIAYDPANHQLFVANRAMNRVEIFNTTHQSPASPTSIDIPGASSADLSADGSTVWIGTITEQIVGINTSTLQVTARYSLNPISPVPNETYGRPEEVLALANGTCLLRLRESDGPDAILALWNPATNSITTDPAAEHYGLGAIARTADYSRIFLATNDSSNDLVLFDSTGKVTVGPISLASAPGTAPLAAANSAGSRYAVLFVSAGASQVLLLDANLQQVNAVATLAAGLAFSRDGTRLYISGGSAPTPAIQVFDGATLAPLGQIADPAIQGIPSQIEDTDEAQLLFAIANRGVSFIDAATPAALPQSGPSFAGAPVSEPSEGPAIGGTVTGLLGQNFESTVQVAFGRQLATSASVSGASLLQATTPPSAISGAANVSAYFPSGWLAVAPDAFSYGPQILQVLPNAGNSSGNDVVQIYGYGFGSDAGKVNVTISAANAAVQKVENVTSIAASLGLDATYPFPLERITLQTPAGTPGNANLVVTSPAGSATSSGAFQYLQSVQTFPGNGLYKFLLYDQARQLIYLTATDHIDAFDLHANALKPGGLPIYCPSKSAAGPCPDADLRGLALTPDGSQLIVADWGSQNIFLLDPDSPGTVSFVPVNVPGYGPARVAATSTQKVFVALQSIAGASAACSSCLAQLDLTASPPAVIPAPQPEVSTLAGSPLLQADAAGDKVFLAFDATHGGPVAFWSASSPNDFTMLSANQSPTDIAISADGSTFAELSNGATEIRDVALALTTVGAETELEKIPTRTLVPGIALNATGTLLYQPWLNAPAPAMPSATATTGAIDIIDTQTGRLRLRIQLPEPLAALSSDTDALHAQFLTIDETGQRLFALTTSGLTIIHLATLP